MGSERCPACFRPHSGTIAVMSLSLMLTGDWVEFDKKQAGDIGKLAP
jgi:hypothetical protein